MPTKLNDFTVNGFGGTDSVIIANRTLVQPILLEQWFEKYLKFLNSFYVILRGSASVYIDPKMTGEGSINEDALSRTSDSKRKSKNKPKPLESEVSVLSGMEKPSDESETMTDGEGTGSVAPTDVEPQVDDDESVENRKPKELLAPLDRSKFGKFIMKYGKV